MKYHLLYLSGKSIPEVSVITGIPRSTIRFRLKRLGCLRLRADGVRLAGAQGRLGSGMLGVNRVFSDEHKKNISLSKIGIGRGTSLKPNGYLEITMGENKGRGEHCVIMEKIIGRKLYSNECVHHINEIRNDNRADNLQLMTKKNHASYHSTKNNPSKTRNSKGRYS